MSKRMTGISLGIGAACAMVAVAAWADAQKKTIKIDQLTGDKGAVTFEHAKHSETYKLPDGKPILCKSCHHTLTVDKPDVKDVKACTSCHVAEGTEQKVINGKKARFLGVHKAGGKWDDKSILLHQTCRTCHTASKDARKAKGLPAINGCPTCHKKKPS